MEEEPSAEAAAGGASDGAPGGEHPAAAESPRPAAYDTQLVLETILEHSRLNIVLFDRDCIVIDVSRPIAEHAHLPREHYRGRSLLEDLPKACHKSLRRTLAGETLEEEERLPPELSEEESWMHALKLPLRDPAGIVHGGLVLVSDISTEKQTGELVEKLTFIDPVTELPNRAMLATSLSQAISGAQGGEPPLALAWLNIDRFKDVNDALGQKAGDALLRLVAERLRERVRSNDLVARLSADDFAVLLARIRSPRHLKRFMERLQDTFNEPFRVADKSLFLTASLGVAVHAGDVDGRELQENAHTAMRAAKALGGGGSRLYDDAAAEDSAGRLQLTREIRDGIERGEFELHYQAQVDLGTMRVQVVEALARWRHPERGLIAPAEFIPFAEQSGLIVPLGTHLLRRACAQLRDWQDTLEAPPRLAVNVSAREVQRSDVYGEIARAAADAGLSPAALEIEFTETAVLANPQRAAEVAAALRAAGATVALDDFGTGFSSLTHLRELPIDCVKIDRSFVSNCLRDHSARAILIAVTHLAHDLGIQVVAEGIETQAQLEFVREAGCDAAQGYHLSRPLPPKECTEHLVRAGSA